MGWKHLEKVHLRQSEKREDFRVSGEPVLLQLSLTILRSNIFRKWKEGDFRQNTGNQTVNLENVLHFHSKIVISILFSVD